MITFILFKCHRFIDNSNDSYLVVKRLMITKNAVVKIQTLIMNHESRPVKLNPVEIHFSKVFKTKNALLRDPTILLMLY